MLTEKTPVLWIPAKILGLPGHQTFGICGKTKRIFKITTRMMAIIIINDIIIDQDSCCEEELRCLNVNCPLNHSTAKSLKIRPDDFIRFPVENHWPGLTDVLEKLCEKYPDGGLLSTRNNKMP
jgi:hypothetical protein